MPQDSSLQWEFDVGSPNVGFWKTLNYFKNGRHKMYKNKPVYLIFKKIRYNSREKVLFHSFFGRNNFERSLSSIQAPDASHHPRPLIALIFLRFMGHFPICHPSI